MYSNEISGRGFRQGEGYGVSRLEIRSSGGEPGPSNWLLPSESMDDLLRIMAAEDGEQPCAMMVEDAS